MMDLQTCRTQMAHLIEEETAALGQLSALLEREFVHMQANDVEQLSDAMRERHQCVARILKVDDDRRVLCRSLNRPHDLKGLEALMKWCDPHGTLGSAWTRCTAAAVHCRGLNDRNGALAGARLQNVQGRLGALINGRRDTVTYGPRGTTSMSTSGQGFSKEI